MVEIGSTLNKMPELPEVETIKNILTQKIVGKKITKVTVLRDKTILNDVNYIINKLTNATITNLSRYGKYLLFHLDNHFVMISHLRMEGKFFYKENIESVNKHDLVIFEFSDKTYLIYNDTRKFGILKVLSEDNYQNLDPLNRVGPDPFMLNDASLLYESYKNKSIPIKSALLDQSVMSGLGNIYVDEVLFETKLSPLTPANKVSKEKLEEILKSSKEILAHAISLGGSTIKSYHPDKGVNGNYQNELKVYGHKDGLCPNCQRHFRKIYINKRGTTFCPHCQKNPCAPLVIGLTGPIGSGKSTVSEYFLKKGFKVIDADKVVNELYKDKDVIAHLKKIIKGLVIKNNEVDKSYLRDYLLSNPNSKLKLEKYIHSQVDTYMIYKINSLSKSDKLLLEVPLLYEAHIDDLVDYSIYVDVNKKNQIEHLKNRGDDIDKMLKINANFDYENDKKKATFVINNNLDLANLYSELDVIYDKLTHQ